MLFDFRRTLLATVPEDYLGAYAPDADTAKAYVAQVVAKVRERMPPATISQRELQARSWWEGPEIYLVIDDYDLVEPAHRTRSRHWPSSFPCT